MRHTGTFKSNQEKPTGPLCDFQRLQSSPICRSWFWWGGLSDLYCIYGQLPWSRFSKAKLRVVSFLIEKYSKNRRPGSFCVLDFYSYLSVHGSLSCAACPCLRTTLKTQSENTSFLFDLSRGVQVNTHLKPALQLRHLSVEWKGRVDREESNTLSPLTKCLRLPIHRSSSALSRRGGCWSALTYRP